MTSPYNLHTTNPDIFEFKSDSGIEYHVYFSNASGYFSAYPDFSHLVKAFGFDVLQNPNPTVSRDARVGATIAAILHSYFEKQPENVLFFFLESADGKQDARKRTFDSWFQVYGQDWLVKYDKSFPIGRNSIHCSLVFLPDHPLSTAIVNGFDQLAMDAAVKPE